MEFAVYSFGKYLKLVLFSTQVKSKVDTKKLFRFLGSLKLYEWNTHSVTFLLPIERYPKIIWFISEAQK